ncbi:MAG: hypothetical protein K2X91_15980 [Thermoleophilia bacterium]|nr:hypothetical protein [Thermoleophilia bacterium]
MSRLLTITEAAPLVGCRDPRTARKRLAALGVPVLAFGGRLYVDEADLLRARRAYARPLDLERPTAAQGVRLAPGERLWDGQPTNHVGQRRANALARGDRGEISAARRAYRRPAGLLADRSLDSPDEKEEP